MKQFTSPTQQKGEVGEKIALKYLVDQGFTIIETNYTKKTGEIDIVAQKGVILHFVEVKTIYNELAADVTSSSASLRRDKRVTNKGFAYSPWDNVSREKLRRFGRTCEFYVLDRDVSRETSWQIDVIAVTVTRETKNVRVEVLWNVII